MSDRRTYGLTPRATDLLIYLRDCERIGTGAPTYADMAFNLRLKSKGCVHRLVRQLVERGVVQRMPGRQQSIALVPERATISLPDDVDGILRAAAKAAGRSPSEHAAALIRHHCPPLQPF